MGDFEDQLDADVDHLRTLVADHTAEADDDEGPATLYETVADWVEEWLAITIDRRTGNVARDGMRWCERWWLHPEALNRIYVLWQEWEAARAAGTMSVWWINHFEPHWRDLTGEDGPFRDCWPAVNGDVAQHEGHDGDGEVLLAVELVPDELLAALPEGPRSGGADA
jgi:hypothetical protein